MKLIYEINFQCIVSFTPLHITETAYSRKEDKDCDMVFVCSAPSVKLVCCHCCKYLQVYISFFIVLGYSLPLCVVSVTQLLVLLFSILTSYDQASAYGLSFADDVQPSDAVTLVQPSVSSLLKTTLTPRVMLRHRCDPHAERKLRKKLKNKEKTIKNLRRRLALKENKTKLNGKNSKVQAHHESSYCFPHYSMKKNFKRFSTNSSLTAIGLKVKDLVREVKYLQRKYMVGIVLIIDLYCVFFRLFVTKSREEEP